MKRKEKEIEEIKKFRKKFYDEHANDYDNEWCRIKLCCSMQGERKILL
ncbi:unnamed protein product [marine sediment metagenome]|uniref:Uncharacterized protein n=1 Tax=marine sediment metagenome TaxID=412755 RepID=X1CC83_9ZZZZ